MVQQDLVIHEYEGDHKTGRKREGEKGEAETKKAEIRLQAAGTMSYLQNVVTP